MQKDDALRAWRAWTNRMREVRERAEAAPVPNVPMLLQVARGDTGSSRRVAQFLLSLWNGDEFKCDLQAVLYLEGPLFDELSNLMNYLQRTNHQLDSLVSDAEMKPIIRAWGSVFDGERATLR